VVRFDFDETFGDDYLHFYLPALTEQRNRREAEVISRLLALKPSERVLDAPCGHGRISALLAEAGQHITGIDASAMFLDVARADAATRGLAIEYRPGDLRSLPVDDGVFDAVVCWFTSFGYFDDDDNDVVLREFRRVLRPGGRLLIETMNRDGFIRRFTSAPFAYVERVGDDMMIDQSIFDPISGRIETDRTVARDGETRTSHHSVRLLTVTEFRRALHAAGFEHIEATDHDGRPVTLDSPRLAITAR
jgi:ubiquinone/menaquinone biosynthesis C-methylase UbiE